MNFDGGSDPPILRQRIERFFTVAGDGTWIMPATGCCGVSEAFGPPMSVCPHPGSRITVVIPQGAASAASAR